VYKQDNLEFDSKPEVQIYVVEWTRVWICTLILYGVYDSSFPNVVSETDMSLISEVRVLWAKLTVFSWLLKKVIYYTFYLW
jgi:hypothetical protein